MIPIVSAALLAGCALSPAVPEPAVATPLSAAPAVAFTDGPAVTDPDLLPWLSGVGRRALQVPVVVEFDDDYRLAVTRAWIGNGGQAPPADAVLLKLDDTAMGIALLDQLKRACPPGKTCAVWLEGAWGPVLQSGPSLSLPGSDAGPKRHDFAVRKLVGLADATATRVRVQVG